MNRRFAQTVVQTAIIFSTLAYGLVAFARAGGVTDLTRKTSTTGCDCHGSEPSTNVTVLILGPDTLTVGQSANYSVTIAGGPAIQGGTNIAASNGALAPISTTLQLFQGELTHNAPAPFPASGPLTFLFRYTAPNTVGQQTLYANGNSVNGDNTSFNDQWNYAPDKKITVRVSTTFAEKNPDSSPSSFALFQNYPNPFNPSTIIRFDLPTAARTSLRVYDLNGREVAPLVDQLQSAGSHEILFVAPSNLASGTYVYKIAAGSFVEQKKMVLVK
jgi:hypothetical protein